MVELLGTAHCRDMYAPNAFASKGLNDSKSVVWAHSIIGAQVAGYIGNTSYSYVQSSKTEEKRTFDWVTATISASIGAVIGALIGFIVFKISSHVKTPAEESGTQRTPGWSQSSVVQSALTDPLIAGPQPENRN